MAQSPVSGKAPPSNRAPNRRQHSRARAALRTFVKEVETAIAAGDKEAARDAFKAAQPEMQRGVKKGVAQQRTVSRKLSRLSARIKAL